MNPDSLRAKIRRRFVHQHGAAKKASSPSRKGSVLRQPSRVEHRRAPDGQERVGCDRREFRMAGQERRPRPPRFLRARSSRSRRQAATGPDHGGQLLEHLALRPGASAAGRLRCAATGCPDRGGSSRGPSRARRAARRRRRRANGSGARARRPGRSRHGCAPRLARRSAPADRPAGRARRPRRSCPRSPIAAAICRGLAAGRRAGVEDALAGLRAGERADELRRFVLHDERARRAASGVSSGLPARDDQAVAARSGVGSRLDAVLARVAAPARRASSSACWRAASAAPARC